MRKFTFAAIMLALACRAGAQQVQLLESEPEGKAAPAVKASSAALKPVEAALPAAAAKPATEVAAPPAAVKPAEPLSSPDAPFPAADNFPELEALAAPAKPAPAPAGQSEIPKPPVAVEPIPVKPAAAPAAPAAVKPAPAAAVVVKPEAAAEIKKAAVQEKKAPAPAPVPAPESKTGGGFAVTKTHTVDKGDTLWDLSAKYYQDPFKWGKIYNANLGVVSNPDRIHPKEELLIPEITEEVKPEPKKALVPGEGDTVKNAEPSSEVVQTEAVEAARAETAAAGPPADTRAGAVSGPAADTPDRADLSEEMPEHQKEWSAGVKVVPDNWRGDGVIAAREKGDDDSMGDGLSLGGEILVVSMSRAGLAGKGDYLAVYMKGADAYAKGGKRLGREIQAVGMLEVLSADGSEVRARVIDAVTPLSKGYLVKKK